MAHDSLDEKRRPPLVAPPRGRRLLLSGVAVACVLGAGFGLWARPELNERQLAITPAPMAPVPRRELRIVVDAPPVEAAPASPTPVLLAPSPEPVTPLRAPTRPAAGLVRVQAMETPPAEPPAPKPVVQAAPRTPTPLAPARPPARLMKAATPAKAPPKLVRKPDHVAAPKPDRKVLVKAVKPPARARIQLAKLDPRPKPTRFAAKAPAAKAIHAVMRAPPHLAKLEKVRLVPARRDAARQAPKPAKMEKVVARRPQAARPVHPPAAPAPKAAGLMKVANTSRCASSDPGAALVCANPSLGAADRQMNRAYQVARAAGVPESQLQRQQQRWLAARTAAAREAPWAVHDVYQARIAELNGMARDAQGPSN